MLYDVPRAPLPDGDTHAPVRFLPKWDNVLLGFADRTRVMSDAIRRKVASNGVLLEARKQCGKPDLVGDAAPGALGRRLRVGDEKAVVVAQARRYELEHASSVRYRVSRARTCCSSSGETRWSHACSSASAFGV